MTIIKKSKIPKAWVSLTISFLLALILIEIWVNNATIEYGAKFKKLETLERALDLENQILENEVAKNASLSSISSKSADLGFTAPSSVQYIR